MTGAGAVRLQFLILGPVEVVAAGRPVVLGSPKERALLAMLALRRGRVVAIEDLIDGLWGETPPGSAVGSVRVLVSRLRKALAEAGASEVIVGRAPGFLLDVEAEQVDADRFEVLRARGSREKAAGDPQSAGVTLRDALGLWRGRALVDVVDSPGVVAEAARFDEAYVATLEERIRADLECGRHDLLVGELDSLVAAHPFREALWSSRMLALYRSGRQADALAAFTELRDRLVGELGIEPSPELRELQQRILAQDPDLRVSVNKNDQDQRASVGSVETVTVLFTDLVGSTELASRVGPEHAEELRREHFGLLRDAITAADGREVKNVGDGLMVAFASAAAAVQCAVSIQQQVERRNRRATHEVQVRVGVSMGDATREGGDFFGPAVVEAARLCDTARGGQVLLSEVTRMLVGRRGDHSFVPVGELELKGLPEPVAACELAWEPLPTARAPLPARLQVLPETAYVGREAAGARLAELWEAARGGEGGAGGCRVALLVGEPGIGKTRLATHVALDAHADGATVLYGRCDEDIGVAYQPWVEALRDLVEHCLVGVLEAHVRDHGGELSRLVPELAGRLPDVPEPRSSEPETERYLLFGAITGLLERASEDEPVVLVLDDLHWADKPSLGLLKHVVAHASKGRLLVLATYRDSDITAADPLSALLADLRRVPGVEWVELVGLDQGDVRSMMAGATGHDLEPEGVQLAEAINRETGGNPFFVSEMLRHLVESGGLVQGSDGRYSVTERAGELGLPRSVRDVIGQRVRRLGDDAEQALSVGAVIGREFDLELLALVTERGEDELLGVVESAVDGSVLRESAQAPGRFVFAHALINHTLYEELSRARRGRLHRRVAEALELLCGDDPRERLGELAYHWSAASQPVDLAKAVSYARQAAELALHQLAPDEALRWSSQALEHLAALPDAAVESDRCDLLILRGDAQRQAGEPGYRKTLLEAGLLAERLTDPDRMARAALANNRGFWSVSGEVDADRVRALQAATAALPEGSPYRPRLLAQLAAELVFVGEFDKRVRPLIDEALGLARRDGDPHARGHVLSLVSSALITRTGVLEEQRTLADELSALADALGDPQLRFTSCLFRCFFVLGVGEIDAFHAALAGARVIAEETGQPWMQWCALMGSSGEAQLAGDLPRAEALATEAMTLGVETDQVDALVAFAVQIGPVLHEQDRLDEILERVAKTASRRSDIPAAQALAAFHLSELGRREEAVLLLERLANDDFGMQPDDAFGLLPLARCGQAAVRVGALDIVGQAYEQLLPHRAHVINIYGIVIGSAEMILGHLAAALGRYDPAEEHFVAATEMHERIGAPLFLARTRLYWGQMLLSRDRPGDADGARALLDQAITVARELGGVAIENDATALLDQARTGS